ncbi:HK97 gp10 family phage protein [Bacillus massiliglaciei]|uniref:HK97 gp10 family phage protein n=1 Tax=Bacillus massiliglaciei TaxID=1816693 RepID=UPI000AB305B2|nr:hypothetical protein [Bacillus massiliglaciei]
MSIQITGMDQLLRNLQSRFGPQRIQQINDKALKRAAQVYVRELKSQFESFKDTGASIDEITISAPFTVRGARTIKVHWKGPHNRYRIIHLNEFGTVKNPNPAGKGAIARSLRNAETAYRNAIKEEYRRALAGGL